MTIAPPAPFPLVVAQSSTRDFVAPGVTRAEFRLQTSAGPLAVHVVSVDTREPTVRLGVVLAHDRLVSSGETVSSMAQRTGAVAGVNADYFDIGNTNQPLNIVVVHGRLVRSPSSRVAFVVGADKRVRFANVTFSGSVRYGDSGVSLTGVNIWPPQGGVSLMTPAYGVLDARPQVNTFALEPSPSGSFQAAGPVVPGQPAPAASLAFGPAAAAVAAPPSAGMPVDVRMTLDPALDEIAEAAGGGPLLLAAAQPVSDPNEPAPEEHDVRFPVSGAARCADSTLLLVAVDGRLPEESIGVTRPEFAALLQGLGAVDAMAFDSGGSATLVARALGDERAGLLNVPSDGRERPVADGIFVYSDAPVGADPRLVARPVPGLALGGAPIELHAAVVDAAGHRLRAAVIPAIVADAQPGEHEVTVHDGGFAASVQYRTVERVAKLTIEPRRPNPQPGAAIALRARGVDAFGDAIALAAVRWSATGGGVVGDGAAAIYRAGTRDGVVAAAAGGAEDSADVFVGRHLQPLPIIAAASAARWHFATAPQGGSGALDLTDGPPGEAAVLTLPYDLTAERAAYAMGDFALPGEPLDFEIDADGDASGVALRAGFVNRLGEREALTLAKSVDWDGWRRLAVVLPPDLNPPVRLASLYVVRLGQTPRTLRGVMRWRNPAVTLAGSR